MKGACPFLWALKCLLKHLQKGGLKEGWSFCSAGVYEQLEVRILVLWASSDLCWPEQLSWLFSIASECHSGVEELLGCSWQRTRVGWNTQPLEFFTLAVQQGCAIASRVELAVVVQNLGFFLGCVCCDHGFPRDASSSPSHSSCFGLNWWSFAVPGVFPPAAECFRCLVRARCA